MKIAYLISSQCHTVPCRPGRMMLPQPEPVHHGAGVAGSLPDPVITL